MTTTPTIAASAIIILISPSERPEAPDLLVAAAAPEVVGPALALAEALYPDAELVALRRLENGGNTTGGFAALQIP
jgi:hypothetical protein